MNPADVIENLLRRNHVHAEWRQALRKALLEVEADYLAGLIDDPAWLPGPDRLLAAFRRDRGHCRYLLFGESPYPRAESANGIAFQDAAVESLWSETGLSKAVNRATSLRNIIKTALVAEGHLQPRPDGSLPQDRIAALDRRGLVGTLDELFHNMQSRGVLAFNALPVLHDGRSRPREARRWSGFLDRLLQQLGGEDLTLILWGRIAGQILALPHAAGFRVIRAEHPYNTSFIHNPDMQALFRDWRLLSLRPAGKTT
jgi:uracil-DNA glycosylase